MKYFICLLLPLLAGCVVEHRSAFEDNHYNCMAMCESGREVRGGNNSIFDIQQKVEKYCYNLCNKRFLKCRE